MVKVSGDGGYRQPGRGFSHDRRWRLDDRERARNDDPRGRRERPPRRHRAGRVHDPRRTWFNSNFGCFCLHRQSDDESLQELGVRDLRERLTPEWVALSFEERKPFFDESRELRRTGAHPPTGPRFRWGPFARVRARRERRERFLSQVNAVVASLRAERRQRAVRAELPAPPADPIPNPGCSRSADPVLLSAAGTSRHARIVWDESTVVSRSETLRFGEARRRKLSRGAPSKGLLKKYLDTVPGKNADDPPTLRRVTSRTLVEPRLRDFELVDGPRDQDVAFEEDDEELELSMRVGELNFESESD